MNLLTSFKSLFSPSDKYQGVIPIKVYVMKLFFLLMFLLVAKDAWAKLISHQGDWNPEIAVAWCSIAAYTTLSGLGVVHTLRMMPDHAVHVSLQKSLVVFCSVSPLV